ncbi:di-heme oxidoredictase family protein [Allorhodopirellula heiligendammensis]|uniref:Cytochrome c n=1 Tax=Allorhodopirellula heiligendammensis TaxID=2714739 RepID=A0A5C6BW85_9BACT|nr:di-heme oxidoredictase family protein [Allorhodopirellula heiligendammensis]TWU16550.1 Cytochrome c [Allorhodopirellula heiligendammensis]
MKVSVLAGVVLALVPATSWAVSPQTIARGAQLFTQQWQPHNPALGGDGLGPLFNAASCAECHQQGGIGGGGEAAFNANSVGIDSIEVYGTRVTAEVLANLVSQFHPGFIQSNNSVLNVLPLPHHGGTSMLRQLHETLTQSTGAEYDDAGGATSAAEVRIANGSPLYFDQFIDGYRVRISARVYSRNTTALFGSGLIDKVSDKQLDQQMRLQKQHAEISGRPSTLADGRYGKFGWRANVASLQDFNEQACANEMGLQTSRRTQSSDATNPTYQNKSTDISDEQIQMLTHFVAALPAPRQSFSNDSLSNASISRGEAIFNQVGCGVCHVRNMPPANGIYSDLLLHDMGSDSIDLSHAEPYIVRRERFTEEVEDAPPGFTFQVPYYGPATMVPIKTNGPVLSSPGGAHSDYPAFTFRVPDGPVDLKPTRVIASRKNPDTQINKFALASTLAASQGDITDKQVIPTRIELREQMHLQPTNFNQEWRTAPLWGLRDSAPYWHDGRAETILEAIAMHDGESAGTRDRFLQLSYEDRQNVLAFLDSLVAP